ncbi:MAG: thioesterase family protein [Candidatus Nitrosocaldus sp.]|nr:thioesterase family protein [Candidatus Nitrosocaldus sp.]
MAEMRGYDGSPGLRPGLEMERVVSVNANMVIDFLGDDGRVLSTPSMIDAMERLCRDMVKPYLHDDEDTVGVRIDARHIAPTPLGMSIRVRASLASIDGRRLLFHVEVHDEREKVGEAVHERFIISRSRFTTRVKDKRAKTV